VNAFLTQDTSGLGKEGRRLWRWLALSYELEGAEPLVRELCVLSDRLTQVRSDLVGPDLKPIDRARLVSVEVKLVGMFTRCWRTLGLADPGEPKRPVGRPAANDRRF